MANPYLVLWCDPTTNTLYSGWNDNTNASTPLLKQGDTLGVEIHWVTRPSFNSAMTEVEFPPSATATLAIGLLDSAPTSGTFKIAYGTDTTGELSYDISATDLQTALNNLDSIDAEGGVTITKNSGQFRIVWNEKGSNTGVFDVETDNLFPTSTHSFVEAKAGSATSSRIILFKVYQSPIAGTSTFTTINSPQITINEVADRLFRIDIKPAPKDGSFQLDVNIGGTIYRTLPIYPRSTKEYVVSVIQNAISAITLANQPTITVASYGEYGYEIFSQATGTQQPISAISAVNNLIGFSSLYGTVSMNTAGVEELVQGQPSASAVLEIQVDVAGEVQTLIQTNVVIINDLVETSTFDVVELGSLMPVDSVIRYDTSQSLSESQKLQARQNISALADSVVVDLNTEINVLEGQVSSINGEIDLLQAFDTANINQAVKTTSAVQFASVTSPAVTVSGSGNTIAITPTGISFPNGTSISGAPNLAVFPLKANNLSDLSNIETARTNLGLGTIATQPASNYLAKADNLAELASPPTARTNLGLGTMATQSATAFCAKVDNLSGLASVSTARTNLGLGTMATETASNYLAKADNLSGLSSASTARENLGLSTSSQVQFGTVNIGTSDPNGAGSFSTVQSQMIKTQAADGQEVQISPQGIFMESENGIRTLNDSTGKRTNIGRNGSLNSEFGLWAYDGSQKEAGITPEGIRFPDGTFQTTSSDGLIVNLANGSNNLTATDLTPYNFSSYTRIPKGTTDTSTVYVSPSLSTKQVEASATGYIESENNYVYPKPSPFNAASFPNDPIRYASSWVTIGTKRFPRSYLGETASINRVRFVIGDQENHGAFDAKRGYNVVIGGSTMNRHRWLYGGSMFTNITWTDRQNMLWEKTAICIGRDARRGIVADTGGSWTSSYTTEFYSMSKTPYAGLYLQYYSTDGLRKREYFYNQDNMFVSLELDTSVSPNKYVPRDAEVVPDYNLCVELTHTISDVYTLTPQPSTPITTYTPTVYPIGAIRVTDSSGNLVATNTEPAVLENPFSYVGIQTWVYSLWVGDNSDHLDQVDTNNIQYMSGSVAGGSDMPSYDAGTDPEGALNAFIANGDPDIFYTWMTPDLYPLQKMGNYITGISTQSIVVK